MVWLEASLAFALLMMIFSTMVSAILEMIYRCFKLRHKGLKAMLENLFDKVIWPRYSNRLTRIGILKGKDIHPKKIRQKFVALFSSNPVPLSSTDVSKLVNFSGKLGGDKRNSISSEEFVERLAGSEFGQCLLEEAEGERKKLIILVKEMVQKFDAFTVGAGEYFAAQSRFFTVVIAIFFAFAINFDSIKVFQTFLINPKVRDGLISQSKEIEKAFVAQNEMLTNVIPSQQVNSVEVPTENDTDTKLVLNEGDVKNELQIIKERSEKIQQTLTLLTSDGIPIGWDKDSKDRYGFQTPGKIFTKDYLDWFLSTLLGGFLIGLGGPFWFNFVGSLNRVISIKRALSPPPTQKPNPQSGKSETGGATTDQPQTPVEIFEVAAEGLKIKNFKKRPLLNPDGRPFTEES